MYTKHVFLSECFSTASHSVVQMSQNSVVSFQQMLKNQMKLIVSISLLPSLPTMSMSLQLFLHDLVETSAFLQKCFINTLIMQIFLIS